MNNPDNAAIHEDSGSEDTSQQTHDPVTFKEKVNDIVDQMTLVDGTWKLPEGEHPEEIQFAATAEKRLRDTQSALSKERTKSSSLLVERDAFKDKLASKVATKLTSEQREELNTLKHTDPDAWKEKLDVYESEAKESLASELKEVTEKATKVSEEQRRGLVLESFVKENPDFELTDDIIANDIPPRITKKLESGLVTFEDFLQEVHTYLKTPKEINKPKVNEQPNLNKSPGGDKPSDSAVEGDLVKNYAKSIIL